MCVNNLPRDVTVQ